MTSIEEFLQEQGRDYFVAGDELPIETLQQLTAEYRLWQRETSRPLSGTFMTAFVANQVVQWMRAGDKPVAFPSGTVRSVVVAPEDTVVFKSSRRLSDREFDEVLSYMKDLFPSNKIAIVDDGSEIEVIRGTAREPEAE